MSSSTQQPIQTDFISESDINPDVLWEQAVEKANKKREAKVGGGLAEPSVAILKRTRMTGGGIMTRAATGVGGNGIRARRIMNLILLLDGSGSMLSKIKAVVEGLNEMFDDLSDPVKSPQRNSIFVTIFIFSGKDAKLFKVGGQEISNVLVTQMPTITVEDYKVGGKTPQNKTILSAFGAGSIRNQLLANQRKGAMTYLVCAGDGANNIWSENTPQGLADYSNTNVKTVATDLLSTEEWILAFALAGYGSEESISKQAKGIAEQIGFPLSRGITSSPDSWRSFFGFVSLEVQKTSKKVLQGDAKGSQVIQDAQGNSNAFFN